AEDTMDALGSRTDVGLLVWAAAATSAGACLFAPNDYSDTTTSGPPVECRPSQDNPAIDDSCGVFVSSSNGDDGAGKGTRAKPYATLRGALAAAEGRPVYACAETFKESIVLTRSATVYGG